MEGGSIMHVIIINGSPRVQDLSNTDKIIKRLVKGMEKADPSVTHELYSISDRKQWDAAREAFAANTDILVAIPLYVECIPGLLLEFLDTLPRKEDGTTMSFVLQSGFAEASQLRCGEEYLKKLAPMLGCRYGGTLVKGDNFSYRFLDEAQSEKGLVQYEPMGEVFIREGGFNNKEASDFAGPEYFGFGLRLMLSVVFKCFAPLGFKKIAQSIGCTKPIGYRPYES